jgi:NAD(P)-dependent dehydrogenase (short-subunit alcohol dehydrogenase family)
MKTVCITGIDSGIGKALAETFAHKGYFVVGTSYVQTEIKEEENFIIIPLDITNDESVQNLVHYIRDKNIIFDILINNAGVLLDATESTITLNILEKTLNVNLIGTIRLTEGVLPYIRKGEGNIITISSIAGQFNRERHDDFNPAYRISKAALNMYVVTLARRLENEQITVSALHPGWVKTAMGGDSADITPEQAALSIFNFSTMKVGSGKYWFNGAQLEW